MLGAGDWGVEVSEETEPLELEGCFEEAVLYSSFVHEESVEDSGAGEVFEGYSAERQGGVQVGRFGIGDG